MLAPAKLVALAVIVWLYMTADKHNQPPTKWAIIGLIGYLLSWVLVDFVVDKTFAAALAKRNFGSFILSQIPTLAGLFSAYLIRKKLLAEAKSRS